MHSDRISRARRELILLFAMTLFMSLAGCRDFGSGPEKLPTRVSLTLVDVGVLESYLHVKVQNPATAEQLTILRNGTPLFMFAPPPEDTLLVDTTLVQGTTYSYRTELHSDDGATSEGASLEVRTLLPTSHNFTWETTLLGGGDPSWLSGAAILNDTLAYAVGAVYKPDSMGVWDFLPFNLARWDGVEWILLRMPFYTICGQAGRTPYPASAILCFGPGDIWTAMDGSQVARSNGILQIATMCLPVSYSIAGIWGKSPNLIYAVGTGGNILRFANDTWQKIESGTTVDIKDVWGVTSKATGKEVIYCAVTDVWHPGRSAILKLPNGSDVQSIPWNPNQELSSIWTANGVVLYACGDGLWRYHSGIWRQVLDGKAGYMNAVRGNGLNDITVADVFGHVFHFNGLTWEMFSPLAGSPDAGYVALAIRDDMIIAVGEGSGKGIITIGRRGH
jgi:hypothetical protein